MPGVCSRATCSIKAASNQYNSGTTPGQAPADSVSTLLYHHADRLTTRLTTDNSGNLANQQGHHPFGEPWYESGTANPSVLRKLTSYTKDTEAGAGQLNYAVFREHSARIARFHMPDPVQDGVGNPQSLNRYAYVANDPTDRTDRLGLMSDEEREARANWYSAYLGGLISGWSNFGGGGGGGGWWPDPSGGLGGAPVGATPPFVPGAGGGSGGSGATAESNWERCRREVFVPCMNDAEWKRTNCLVVAAGLCTANLAMCEGICLAMPELCGPCLIVAAARCTGLKMRCEYDFNRDTRACYDRLIECASHL